MKRKSEAIKLVIFDLDGTLVDAYEAIAESFNFTMRALRLPLKNDLTIRRAVGWGDHNLLRPFVKSSKLLKTALLIYRSHHQGTLRRKTKFLPGAQKVIAGLKKKGYKLAIASNRPTKFTNIILRCLKIKKYFDRVLCADKMKRAKPHPDILLAIARRLSVKPAEAFYVGDMTVDILAGKKAGMATVAVLTGSHTKKEMARLKPYKIINDISVLPEILRNLNGQSLSLRTK